MDQLIEELKTSDLYLEFVDAAKKVEQHHEIPETIKQIKHLQKQRVNANFLEKEEFVSKLNFEIDSLHQSLEQIPLYVTYTELKEELEIVIERISVSIETSINKKS